MLHENHDDSPQWCSCSALNGGQCHLDALNILVISIREISSSPITFAFTPLSILWAQNEYEQGLLMWASWPLGSPKSRGRQGTNCVLLIHSPTRGPPSRRSIVDTEKIKVRPFNIDVSSPCFGIKYFVKVIIHIYKHVHLLYLYHRLRCTRIYWYTVCLNVYAGFYVEVATCSNFYSLCTPSMINFRLKHKNLAKLRFHQTALAPQTPPCEGRFSLESKIRVNFSASMDTKGGFVCGPGQQWWTSSLESFSAGDSFLLLLQEWLRIEYNHIGFQTPHSFPGSTVPPLQEPFLLAFPVVHWLRSPLPAEQWLWKWIVQGIKIPWYLGLAFWKPTSGHINYIDIEWCVL